MVIIIKRKYIISAIILIVLMFFLSNIIHISLEALNSRNLCTIVIDPGHGGIDGGASSANGVLESHVNLEIALELKKIFENSGCRVIMTREKDIGLYSEGKSIRSKKIEDLVNRNNIMNDEQVDYAIMLHLNSFPDASCYGAQCFYPNNSKDSKLLAEKIQDSLIEGVDDKNHRKAKMKSDVLLMKDIESPRVLIECGFLSNPRESKLLVEKGYQRQLAECIHNGFFKYLDIINEGKKDIEYIVNRVEYKK